MTRWNQLLVFSLFALPFADRIKWLGNNDCIAPSLTTHVARTKSMNKNFNLLLLLSSERERNRERVSFIVAFAVDGAAFDFHCIATTPNQSNCHHYSLFTTLYAAVVWQLVVFQTNSMHHMVDSVVAFCRCRMNFSSKSRIIGFFCVSLKE